MSEVEAFADGEPDVSVVKPKRRRAPRGLSQAAIAAAADKAEQAAKAEVRPELRGGVPNPSDRNMKRIKIVLEDNTNIPRGGQFFCVNGYTALIRPGREVRVPEAIVDVLNNAIETVAERDESLKIVGYKQVMRYPYRNLGPA